MCPVFRVICIPVPFHLFHFVSSIHWPFAVSITDTENEHIKLNFRIKFSYKIQIASVLAPHTHNSQFYNITGSWDERWQFELLTSLSNSFCNALFRLCQLLLLRLPLAFFLLSFATLFFCSLCVFFISSNSSRWKHIIAHNTHIHTMLHFFFLVIEKKKIEVTTIAIIMVLLFCNMHSQNEHDNPMFNNKQNDIQNFDIHRKAKRAKSKE